MSTYACSVPGCSNTRANNDYTFFKLPTEHERRKKWLEAMKREDLLDLSNKSYTVCSAHFEARMLIEKRLRKLHKNAIPTKNLPEEPIQQTSKESNPATSLSSSSAFISSVKYLETEMMETGKVMIVSPAELISQSSDLVPMEIVTSSNVKIEDDSSLQNDDGSKETEIGAQVENDYSEYGFFIKENVLNTEDSLQNDDFSEFLVVHKSEPRKAPTKYIKSDENCICKSFDPVLKKKYVMLMKVKTQLLNTSRKEYLSIAFNLRINNPYLYKMMHSTLQLPKESILRRINVQVSPRMDEIQLQLISTKLKSMVDGAKYCSLLVSRVKVTPQLYYMIDKDEVIGMQDVAECQVSNELANYAYVAMIQGLAVDWSMPVAISFVAKNYMPTLIHNWIQHVVTRLYSIGIDIKAIIVPFLPIFQTIAKLFYEKTILSDPISRSNHNNQHLYCYESVKKNSKIYYLFDMSHLLNRLVIDLKKRKHYVDNQIISWDYLQPIYENDLNPFLFSSEVYTILCAYINHNIIPESGMLTAVFVNSMTKITEKHVSEKFKDCPLVVDKNYEDALKNLQDILINVKYQRNNQEVNLISCTTISTILNTIIELHKELKTLKISLIPSRIQMVNLNKFLDSVRNLQGRVINPSPIRFLRAFRRKLVKHLLSSRGKSVKQESLDLQECWNPESYLTFQKRNSRLSMQKNTPYRIKIPSNEPIRYIASFLIYECYKVHTDCKEFWTIINNLPSLEAYTHYDDYFSKYNTTAEFYGKLKTPPRAIITYLETVEDVINNYISRGAKNHLGFGTGALDIILMSCTFVSPCTCFPLNYLLTVFIRMKIYHVCTARNKLIRMNRIPQ